MQGIIHKRSMAVITENVQQTFLHQSPAENNAAVEDYINSRNPQKNDSHLLD